MYDISSMTDEASGLLGFNKEAGIWDKLLRFAGKAGAGAGKATKAVTGATAKGFGMLPERAQKILRMAKGGATKGALVGAATGTVGEDAGLGKMVRRGLMGGVLGGGAGAALRGTASGQKALKQLARMKGRFRGARAKAMAG